MLDMLRAFTTGHSGGGTTLHANSLEDVPVRLDSLGALAGMESSALARLAQSAIDLIVHIDRRGSDRKLTMGRFELEGEWLAIREITLLDD
jgi:pilus assembly protein CpaF